MVSHDQTPVRMPGRESPSSGSQAKALRFDMEVLVSYILLAGVLLSVLLIVLGVLWRWQVTGRLGLDYSIAGMNVFAFTIEELRLAIEGAFRPRLLVSLGIATLMLTPYVRVLVSMLYFALAERNWKYTVFTGIVFCVLTYSIF